VDDNHLLRELAGERRKNLAAIEEALDVRVGQRGNLLTIAGAPTRRAVTVELLEQLVELLAAGHPLSSTDIAHAARLAAGGGGVDLREFMDDTIVVTARRRPITPRSPNQKRYVDAMRNHDVVFGIGPAGTGKTYLAVACAVEALQRDAVRRLVLVRPAVEAGERLGFLPGDMAQKVDPYLRPMYDALYEMVGFERVARLIERNVIEVAPLAFMRGRTLNESFIILDEAQNTTVEQMKMFLTRIGFGSRAVVTGDVTQTDLPANRQSGLRHAMDVLADVPGIAFSLFTARDVVRHALVARIVQAYERSTPRQEPG
jgi:phosphate starvation-inducible PhoH-like protein